MEVTDAEWIANYFELWGLTGSEVHWHCVVIPHLGGESVWSE
jgi:hypothetical protein